MILATASWNPLDPPWSSRLVRSREKIVRDSRFRLVANATRPTSTTAGLPPSPAASLATCATSSRTFSRRRRRGAAASSRCGANSSVAMILRSARHRGALLGSHATELLAWSPVESGEERLAKAASCLCRISRATAGEEATTVVTAPSRSDMSGP
ncbi:Os08g0226232 [Oryza sativa Japonica Group]|uniref:Os08g0226232 protein n=1 Tax=Oryza sativa subsp. japonica TaxID=39947 RepID=A0A0P0XDE6_ORYSJ|nr:hypothetical protein EE612_042864 [Oryza sativa]BAT04403.1 Os08g0226232 [Oryza sativa Japonica Group]